MVSRFSSLSSLECESCQLWKHTRVSFPKRLESRTKSPFELVHIDVWGPSRTVSTLGFRYLVTFIDDFSRCTWLFLMISRTELFSIFQKFFAEIHNQVHTSIRILRGDNALEYLSSTFSDFLSSHGILHQFSCTYTLQQNGVVERKNRHLVETARTLLLHHTVPQRFWGDVILTTCYLINHMPSSILGDQVPHSLLFPNQPLFFSLRVFSKALVLSTYLLLAKINLLLRQRSASSLVIPAFNAGTIAILPIHIDTSFLLMSHFFKHFSLFSTPPPSSPEVLSLPLIFPIPTLSSKSSATSPHTLQVYTRHPCTDTKPPDDSSPMAPSSTSSVLPSPTDPPITIQIGTRSSRNPHLIYPFLSYHRLSSPYSTFISTLSFVPIPHTVHEALFHPVWKQAMVEEMAALHSIGTWDLVPC